MPSDAVEVRLDVIAALLAGILGALFVLVWSSRGPAALVAAILVGSALAWLAVEWINDDTEGGSESDAGRS